MLAKRIIPCLDVTAGRVVKGTNFVDLRDAVDPIEIARRYDEQGADEVTFLDITASSDQRDIILHIVEACAAQVFIPLIVGGPTQAHQGLKAINWLIRTARPRYHFHGHVHFERGNLAAADSLLGSTKVMNVYPYKVIEVND